LDASFNTLLNFRFAGNALYFCAFKEGLYLILRVISQDCNRTLGGISLHKMSKDYGSVFILYFSNLSLVGNRTALRRLDSVVDDEDA
jgi:hypothetical protein